MNIYIISRGYPSEKDPQWGCFEKDQALALKAMGHKVIIMCVDGRWHASGRKWGISHISENGIEIYNIYLFPFAVLNIVGHRFRLFLRQIITLFLYERIIRKQNHPDIVYAHYLNNIYSALVIKEKYEIPLVGIEHWSMLAKKKIPGYVVCLGSKTYRNVDSLISVSQSLRSNIYDVFNVDSQVVSNMIGEEFMINLPSKKKVDATFKFVSIGSLIPRKGYDILLDAFERYLNKYPASTLSIIGIGKEMKSLKGKISKKKLEKHVFFLGKKNKYDIVQELLQSNAFVLASRSETFGVVYIEALSLGLPVIATECGGPESFIDDSNGIIVPVDDMEKLSQALQKIRESWNSYDRNIISEACRKKYAPSVVAAKLTDIFNSTLNIFNRL